MHVQGPIIALLSLSATALAARRGCEDKKSISVNGRNCKQQCGIDYSGSSYKSTKVSSYQDCVKVCAADSKCTIAEWNRKTGYCSLHTSASKSASSRSIDAVVCDKKKRHTTTCTTSRTTSQTTTSSTTKSSSSTVCNLPSREVVASGY